ncbi:MAG: branched-chain amino acid ABC transporter permease [Anaerolineaceae bacterium]|nr:MAG: branched-chain amino acid ABC transporter permease [Anaerolineaceae bacterium]
MSKGSRAVRFRGGGLGLFIQSPLHIVGTAFLLFLVYVAVSNIAAGDYTLRQFLQNLIFGLAQGSIYSLIALGYTLVYGILFMINFAHGEVFTAGAYSGFFTMYTFAQSGFLQENTLIAILLTFLSGTIASVMVAVALERVAYRPLRNAPRLVPLITAIGASITLQQLYLRLFGASARRFPDINLYILPDVFTDLECRVVDGVEQCLGMDIIGGIYPVEIFGIALRLRPISFIVFFGALFIMWALWMFIQKTKTGRAMRAVAEDKSTSALMGINVDRVIVTTFILGGALAGAGAVLFVIIPGNGQVNPLMGFFPGIKAFTAAVIGGIGNVPGAMFGGLFLGVAESVGPSLLGISNQLRDVISFGLLVLVLIFRPTGFFGEVLSEKKV